MRKWIREDIIKLLLFLGSFKVNNRMEKSLFLCSSCHLTWNVVMDWIHKTPTHTNVDMCEELCKWMQKGTRTFNIQKTVNISINTFNDLQSLIVHLYALCFCFITQFTKGTVKIRCVRTVMPKNVYIMQFTQCKTLTEC